MNNGICSAFKDERCWYEKETKAVGSECVQIPDGSFECTSKQENEP